MRQINIRFTVQKFSNFSYMFYFAFINFYTFTSLFLKKKKKGVIPLQPALYPHALEKS
jgi:hypothetical protein